MTDTRCGDSYAPPGWACTRLAGHSGPCALIPIAPPTVTYFAISLFSSRTFWLNAAAGIVALLSATEVVTIIPLKYVPLSTALVAACNIALRLATVRPVALIAPGTSAPVLVPRIDPPAPPTITD